MPRVAGPGRQVWDGSSSGDDDPVSSRAQGAQAGELIFERYLNELGSDTARDGDQLFTRGVQKVRQYLASTAADSSACLICLGTIKPTEAVWSCAGGCYAVLHMTCMQEWARSQIDQCVLKTMNRLTQFPGAAAEARATAEWGCPKCRQPYPASDVPRTYTCFCGKVVDPEWDPWRTAHSCGDLCGRPLAAQGEGGCTHTCLLLCHPGPCPPCPLVVNAQCHCGARRDRRRCGQHEFSCGGECCARLACGHVCREACHPGECPPCDLQVEAACRCGVQVSVLPCSERDFQCDRVCGQRLACGNHSCEQVCHAGPCGLCPDQGVRTCPCGQVEHDGLSCMDKVPTCGGTCGKMLPCGQHKCQDRCHAGECSSCRATVTKLCRCGKLQREVPCASELLCDRRCTATRACGRHPCKRRCCPGGPACPPCEETCGRKLRCGNHRCPAPCHQGPCRPCPLTVGFACACGAVTASLPCGAEARAVPPRCPAPCPVPAVCRHTPTPPHRCHYGPCPPCTSACGTMQGCGHPCGATTCHDPPPPAVPAFVTPTAPKVHLAASAMLEHLGNGFGADGTVATTSTAKNGRAGAGSLSRDAQAGSKGVSEVPPPAAVTAVQARQVLEELRGELPSSCPLCEVPVVVACFGQHEERTVDCSQAFAYRCARPCGRPLICGNHTCPRPCHTPTSMCQECDQKCGLPRPCGHPCTKPCHAAPCLPCAMTVRTPCHCGKASLSLPCASLAAARAPTTKTAATATQPDVLCCGKPCHKPLPSCPHPCRAPCHPGACPGATRCEEEVTVRCACKRLRAKWSCHQVAEALVAAGRPAAYDATTTLRLLPCDGECAAAGEAGTATPAAPAAPPAKRGNGNGDASGTKKSAATEAAGKGEVMVDGGGGAGGKARLNKAQREAEAAKREADRQRQAKLKQLRSGMMWALVLLAGLLLGVGVPRLLAWLDEQAQSKWRVPV